MKNKTAEEILKEFIKTPSDSFDLYYKSDVIQAMEAYHAAKSEPPEDVTKAIEETEVSDKWRKIQEAFQSSYSLKSAIDWIDVKDRLPEKAGRYICHKKNGLVCELYWQNKEPELIKSMCQFWYNDILQTSQVTHWRPLPPPPEKAT